VREELATHDVFQEHIEVDIILKSTKATDKKDGEIPSSSLLGILTGRQ
jgi:hypothetical protein